MVIGIFPLREEACCRPWWLGGASSPERAAARLYLTGIHSSMVCITNEKSHHDLLWCDAKVEMAGMRLTTQRSSSAAIPRRRGAMRNVPFYPLRRFYFVPPRPRLPKILVEPYSRAALSAWYGLLLGTGPLLSRWLVSFDCTYL